VPISINKNSESGAGIRYAIRSSTSDSVKQIIGTITDRWATYDFLLTFHSNHGSISSPFPR